MTEVDPISLTLSLASFVVSIWAVKETRRATGAQREAARVSEQRERRSLAAVHFLKYSDLLSDVRDATQAAKAELHSSADKVMTSLGHLVDTVADRGQGGYSRHLFGKMSDGVFDAMVPELAYQPEIHVLMRYGGVRRRLQEWGDACRHPEANVEEYGRWQRALARFFPGHTRVSWYPEQALLSSIPFATAYRTLDSRLDAASARRLILEAIDRIDAFSETRRRCQPIFESNEARLTAAIDRNAAEEFKLQESPELWSRIRAEMCALGLLASLNLDDLKEIRAYEQVDAVPEFVYAGIVLQTVAKVADRSRHSSEPMAY